MSNVAGGPQRPAISVRGGAFLNQQEANLEMILDATFGNTPGTVLVRSAQSWQAALLGTGMLTTAVGAALTCSPRFKVDTKPIVGVVAATGGAILAWSAPEGGVSIVTDVVLYTTVKSTGAATVSIGVAATSTTSSANLIDTLDVGTAVVCADNITDKGTNGKTRQLMSASQFVTVTGSADTTGLLGTLYIFYLTP